MKKEMMKYWSEHPIVSGLIVAFVTVLLENCLADPVFDHYFPVDTASTFIGNYLVDTGYVDAAILEEESLNKQFQIIYESFEEYDEAVQTALVSLGANQADVGKMERAVRLSCLPSLAEDVVDRCADQNAEIIQKNKEITTLKDEKTDLQNELESYKQRKEAELKQSYLIVDGELLNNGDSINNVVAIVEGNKYYSEALLNTYLYPNNLTDKIAYNVQENMVVVGNAKPEKVKFSWDMAFNPEGPSVYTGESGKNFVMATDSFTEGVVLDWNDYFYVRLKGEYSKMTFTYGHIDGTDISDLDLTIIALDDDNEGYTKTLATIELDGEMTHKNIEIPIGYADAIKIVVSGYKDHNRRFTEFGLANIYFYS